MTATKVSVSVRALLARVNRKLAHEYLVLKRCKSDSRWYNELGDFYAVSISRNHFDAQHVELEKWAKELGVLKPYEKLAD